LRDWGDYRKLYEKLSPDFERLPYRARCMGADILRRGDRQGRIIPGNEFNEKLVSDLAFHVRAHTDETDFLRLSLEVLLTDGYLIFRSGYLTIRNFVAAQRSEAADRMAKKRALDAGLEPDDTVVDGDDSDEQNPSDVTSERPPRARTGLVSSGLVSSDSGSSTDPGSTQKPRSPRKVTLSDHVPATLAVDWAPSATQAAALAAKWQVTEARILAEVPEFRWYWTEGKGKGKRCNPRGWAQCFGNRVNDVAKRGDLFVERLPPSRPNGGSRVAPRQPDSGYRATDYAEEGT
jgi:hypothetical protein